MGNGLSDQTPILSSLPSFQSFHIVILGLDCAGKTTVLYRLQFNEFVNTVPTKGFNTEKIKVTLGNSKTVTFHFWDVGGQEKLRPLWKSYTRCTDGIVFVVDSVDVERMEEAKTELHKITRISENQGVPVLIIANKQDLRNSLSLSEIEKMLAMSELSSSTPWHLQPTCAIIGDGLKEGLEKLHDMIIKRRKMLRQQKKKRWVLFWPFYFRLVTWSKFDVRQLPNPGLPVWMPLSLVTLNNQLHNLAACRKAVQLGSVFFFFLTSLFWVFWLCIISEALIDDVMLSGNEWVGICDMDVEIAK